MNFLEAMEIFANSIEIPFWKFRMNGPNLLFSTLKGTAIHLGQSEKGQDGASAFF